MFTFRHLSDPDLDTPWVWYYYAIKGIKAHKAGEVSADAVGVEKLDDQTIRVWGEGGSALICQRCWHIRPRAPYLSTGQKLIPNTGPMMSTASFPVAPTASRRGITTKR